MASRCDPELSEYVGHRFPQHRRRDHDCGNANTIAPGVRAALADIYRQHTGGSAAQAQAWLAELRAADRFLEDVWGG
ncbi:hypothetical protein ACTXG6_37975 [Pseudonocardia sp. Cha107L01]|uniref:hypothetical protein n=1 Tax=Pseudonocardia sp. Cha107L01 TaxID=3457576 RepID=UPI00403E3DC4